MLDTILQTSGSDIIAAINLAISAVAALVALLVLWFTALKGPDIVIVSSHPKVVYMEPPKADLSLTRLEFEPVDIVFANNGSRSGALIEIVAKFRPLKTFQPFFWMEFVTVQLRSDKSDPTLQLPAIIPERGTLVARITMGLLLRSWKDVSRLDEIQGGIGEALKEIWKDGRIRLSRFAELDQPIGVFEVLVHRTARRRLHTSVERKLVSGLDLPALPSWIIQEARKSLNKFSEVYPPDYQAVNFIRTALDQIRDDVTRNNKLLEISDAQGNLAQISVQGWERWFGTWRNQNDQTYRGIITRNRSLTAKIADYYQMVVNYNKRLAAGSEVEKQVLGRMRVEIRKIADDLEIELLKYQQTIVESTAHLLPV